MKSVWKIFYLNLKKDIFIYYSGHSELEKPNVRGRSETFGDHRRSERTFGDVRGRSWTFGNYENTFGDVRKLRKTFGDVRETFNIDRNEFKNVIYFFLLKSCNF